MKTAFKIKLSFAGIIITCLFIIGCSPSQPDPSPIAVSNQDKIVYKDLASKYKQLFNQNVELRKRLNNLEQKRQNENDQSDQTIKNLTNTIQLLEINLKQMNSRLINNSERLTQLSAKETKPISIPSTTSQSSSINDKKTEISGLSEDFQTPEGSKAIKTIPLLQNESSKTSDRKSESKNNSNQISKITVEEEDPNSVFITKKPKSAWDDPDLNPPSSPIKLKVVSGAKKLYQQAFKTYSNRDFKNAIRLFSEFVKRYPSDMDADNSQYWIGQSYYQLEDLLSAEHAFRKVLQNYPHNDTKRGYKTPDAILMLGRIYTHRNQPIKGRYYYEKVIERFPTSRSAAKAKREVQSMRVF